MRLTTPRYPPRRKRLVTGMITIVVATLTACLKTLTGPELHGEWGGEHVRVTVTEIGAMLSFDCASGTMDARPDPGESGRFDVPGTWTRGQPVFMVGQEPAPQPARYIGRIMGRTIQFTITILETEETIGVYEATLGREPELYFCN